MQIYQLFEISVILRETFSNNFLFYYVTIFFFFFCIKSVVKVYYLTHREQKIMVTGNNICIALLSNTEAVTEIFVKGGKAVLCSLYRACAGVM